MFRIVGERPAWQGRRISVAVTDVEGPDGDRFEREIVHHPGAVAMVPLHDDGTVTLIHQFRVAVGEAMWEIPAGMRDVADEPTEETAQRELGEEVGLRAGRLEYVARFHNSVGFSDEAVAIYLATELSEVPDDRQAAEEQHMEVDRVPFETALAMVDDGRITDAKTVIALLMLAHRGL
ncbi:MAG TPA: NUDIX hydrolase [Acidimicrobiales bacterium]|jgi:ADP-ribose diphosphatase|nr:NUDIX hydrolase [Acidimicrobiales bacterium]